MGNDLPTEIKVFAGLVLLAVGLCAAVGGEVSDDTFTLEGDHYQPSAEATVSAQAKILERVGQQRKMKLLERRISELVIKNRVKDERIATLELSQNNQQELGESQSTSEPPIPETKVGPEDLQVLKYLPQDVRSEVQDFYAHGDEGTNTGKTEHQQADAMKADSDLAMSEEFPENFGDLTVVDGTHSH